MKIIADLISLKKININLETKNSMGGSNSRAENNAHDERMATISNTRQRDQHDHELAMQRQTLQRERQQLHAKTKEYALKTDLEVNIWILRAKKILRCPKINILKPFNNNYNSINDCSKCKIVFVFSLDRARFKLDEPAQHRGASKRRKIWFQHACCFFSWATNDRRRISTCGWHVQGSESESDNTIGGKWSDRSEVGWQGYRRDPSLFCQLILFFGDLTYVSYLAGSGSQFWGQKMSGTDKFGIDAGSGLISLNLEFGYYRKLKMFRSSPLKIFILLVTSYVRLFFWILIGGHMDLING